MWFVFLLARLAVVLYLARFPLEAAGYPRGARSAWTAGAALLALHVLAAFGFVHDWSHADAVEVTARRTRDSFGVDAGFGVWANYACVAIWGADAVRLWLGGQASIDRRDAWFWFVQAYLAFMVFFGAVVFGSVWWLVPIGATVAATIWLRRSRRETAE